MLPGASVHQVNDHAADSAKMEFGLLSIFLLNTGEKNLADSDLP